MSKRATPESGLETVSPLRAQQYWGYPKEPTPGAKFKLSGNPYEEYKQGAMEGITTLNPNQTLKGALRDRQMTIARKNGDYGGGSGLPGRKLSEANEGSVAGPDRLVAPSSAKNPYQGGGAVSDYLVAAVYNSSGSYAGRLGEASSNLTQTTMDDHGFKTENMENEDEQNTVSGFMSNGQVISPQMMVFTAAQCEAPGEHDLLIMKRDTYDGLDGYDDSPSSPDNSKMSYFSKKFSSLEGYGRPFAAHQGFHLAGFNYYMAIHQTFTNEAGVPISSTDPYFTKNPANRRRQIERHCDLINHYCVFGAINSEQFASGGASFVLSSSPAEISMRGSDQSSEKALNVVIEGGCWLKNIWGPVKAGYKLYLIWKKVKLPDNYFPDSRISNGEILFGGSRTITTSKFTGAGMGGAHQRYHSMCPFQLVPWTDGIKEYPVLDDVEFTSELEPNAPWKKMRGKVIYVGEVTKPASSTTSSYDRESREREAVSSRAMWDYRVGAGDDDGFIEVNVECKFLGGDLISF